MLGKTVRLAVAVGIVWLVAAFGDATAWRDNAGSYGIVPGVRVGPITTTTSESGLRREYGKTQIRRGQIPLDDEGGSKLGSILFPGTSDELRILWRGSRFDRPHRVLLNRSASRWKTTGGIGVGTTLEELERANAGEFEFAAFAWDGAGWITSWLGGQLASKCPTDLIRLRLYADGLDRLAWQEQEPLIGSQRQLRSSDPALSKIRLRVGEMQVMIR